MHDRRVAWMRARAAFHRNEAVRLEAGADAAEAARAAGVCRWGSELPPDFLRMVLERLPFGIRTWGAMRATCSTWSSVVDAWRPYLQPWSWTAVMEGKLGWFQSVTRVDLLNCVEGISSSLTELRSLPSLHALVLPASCTERVVDAEALYGFPTLTELRFAEMRDEDVLELEEHKWALDLSRLTTLTSLDLKSCATVRDTQVQAASNLSGLKELKLCACHSVTSKGLRAAMSSLTALNTLDLSYTPNTTTEVLRAVSGLSALTDLNLHSCRGVTTEGLRAVSCLTALTSLRLGYCPRVKSDGLRAVSGLTALTTLAIASCSSVNTEVLRAVSGLTALTDLDVNRCDNVSDEGLRAVSGLTALTSLDFSFCFNLTDEGLRTLRSLTALTTLKLNHCVVTAAGKQALLTALPKLTIFPLT